jgi:hypothetical protein
MSPAARIRLLLPTGLALLALAVPDAGAQGVRRPDLLNDRVVLELPGTDRAVVREGITYAQTDSGALAFDLYLPPANARKAGPLPVVVFVNGIGDRPGIGMRTWGIYRSWARLVTAKGLAGIVHDTRLGHVDEDPRALLAHLRREGKALGIDGENVILWFCSANTRAAWPIAQDPANDHVRAAVLYYGSPDTILTRPDLPVLIGRAGLDLPFFNSSLDAMVARALRANAPFTMLNLPNGHHAFDAFDEDDQSRAAVAATLDWMVAQATPGMRIAHALRADEVRARRLITGGDWTGAEAAARAWLSAEPENGHGHSVLAQALYNQRRFADAATAYAKAGDAGSNPAFNWYNAACSAALAGDKERALDLLTKAVGTGMMQDRGAIRRDTDLELLVGDPRFESLVGSAPPSSASAR